MHESTYNYASRGGGGSGIMPARKCLIFGPLRLILMQPER